MFNRWWPIYNVHLNLFCLFRVILNFNKNKNKVKWKEMENSNIFNGKYDLRDWVLLLIFPLVSVSILFNLIYLCWVILAAVFSISLEDLQD